MSRPTWDQVWDAVAQTIRHRSLCSRAQVGAVIVDTENRVVSTGYNGPPAGFTHIDLPCQHWCLRGATGEGLDKCVSVHAEANALLSGDRSSWQGGTMYVTKHPCMECAKLIANSGLARVVASPTPPTLAEERHVTVYTFLLQCGLEVELIPPVTPAQVLSIHDRY